MYLQAEPSMRLLNFLCFVFERQIENKSDYLTNAQNLLSIVWFSIIFDWSY